jgi:GDP-L-fucose synthase
MAVMAAAITGGAKMAQTEPWGQVTDNVVMDAQMLEAFYFGGVKRVIYISSATVYQELDGRIGEEDLVLDQDPPAAYHGVGWAKRYAEKLSHFWHMKTGMEVLIARLGNVFGPYAKFDPVESNFIAATIRKAVDRIDPFPVWGSPDVVRDVLYADDFGDAIVAMLGAAQISFDVFNIGSGRATTVAEIVASATKHAGYTPSSIVYDRNMPTTIGGRVLDCSKAERLLDWRPTTSVDDGVRQTVEWWVANREIWAR